MDRDAISDKTEISEVLIRYAKVVDSKDWTLRKLTLTGDAHIDLMSGEGSRVTERKSRNGWRITFRWCRRPSTSF